MDGDGLPTLVVHPLHLPTKASSSIRETGRQLRLTPTSVLAGDDLWWSFVSFRAGSGDGKFAVGALYDGSDVSLSVHVHIPSGGPKLVKLAGEGPITGSIFLAAGDLTGWLYRHGRRRTIHHPARRLPARGRICHFDPSSQVLLRTSPMEPWHSNGRHQRGRQDRPLDIGVMASRWACLLRCTGLP